MSPRIRELKFHVYDGTGHYVGEGSEDPPLIDADLPVEKDDGVSYQIVYFKDGPRAGEEHICLVHGLNYIPAWWAIHPVARRSENAL